MANNKNKEQSASIQDLLYMRENLREVCSIHERYITVEDSYFWLLHSFIDLSKSNDDLGLLPQSVLPFSRSINFHNDLNGHCVVLLTCLEFILTLDYFLCHNCLLAGQ